MDETIKVIEGAISRAGSHDCFSYRQELLSIINNLGEEGEQKNAIQILIDVLSYHIDLKDPKQPFHPFAIFDGKRTAAIWDLAENDVETLSSLFSETGDYEIKARIADVIWTRDKQYKFGQAAIEMYLLSANRLEDWDSWTNYHKRVKRALQLALIFGRNNEKVNQVNDYIKRSIFKINGEDPTYLTGVLVELLLEQKNVDVNEFMGIIDQKILVNLNSNEYSIGRYYLELKHKCYKKLGLSNEAEETMKSVAISYENEVKHIIETESDNYMLMIKLLEAAIKTYRNLPGMKQNIDKLLFQLEAYKKKMSQNLKEFSHEIDITGVVIEIEKNFRGLNKNECIVRLAYMQSISSMQSLEDRVKKSFETSPLTFLMSTDIIDNNGRRIISMPNLNVETEEEKNNALEAYMLKEAANNHSFISSIIIGYALRVIKEEHEINKDDLKIIVDDNDFVPKGREEIFTQGLYEGFKGNFMTAIHLLIPQIENSFREFAKMCGDNVTTFEDDGKEQAKSLNSIFELPNFVAAFDEDLLFDLRSLLTEKYGSNMRNKLAHGLLSYEEASSATAAYVWWISLRLCCMYSRVISY